MAERKPRPQKNVMIAVIAIVVILALYYAVSSYQNRPVTVNTTVELCNIGDLRYDPETECRNVINARYGNLDCSISFENLVTIAGGSCRDCRIACR